MKACLGWQVKCMKEAVAYGVQQSRKQATTTKVIFSVRFLALSSNASPDLRKRGQFSAIILEENFYENYSQFVRQSTENLELWHQFWFLNE